MAEIELITRLINNLGVPIAVMIWLFYEKYKMREEFKSSVDQNTKVVKDLHDTIKLLREKVIK